MTSTCCFSVTLPMMFPPLVSHKWSVSVVSIGSPRTKSQVVSMAPQEERLTRRHPLDFPMEWERPRPGRRPDIFPQFSPMKTPLPPPLPFDPPVEDDEEEEENVEEEEEKNPEEGEEEQQHPGE